MNSFLQRWLSKSYGSKVAPYVRGTVDTVTDPETYKELAKNAEVLLRRNLPPQFSGANFSNIPMSAIGLLNKLYSVPGPQQAIQGGMVSRAIDQMAGITPRIARSTGQTIEGALRAPSIGQQVVRPITTYNPPNITQSFDPFMRDYGLTRELMRRAGGNMSDVAASLLPKQGFNPIGNVGGLIQNLNKTTNPLFQKIQGAYKNLQAIGPTALNPLATQNPTTTLGRVGKFFNPLNPYNVSGTLGGAAISAMLPENDPNKGNAELLLYTPGGLIPKIAALGLFGTTPAGPRDESKLMRQYGAFLAQKPGGGSPPTLPPSPTLPPPPPTLPPSPTTLPPSSTTGSTGVPVNGSFVGNPSYRGVGVSNGAGVSALRQNVQDRALTQEVLNAAQQYYVSPDISPSSFYAGQQQLGRSMEQTGELQRQLKDLGGAMGMTPEALMQWAQANPGLAYRELQRLQGRNT